MKIKTQNKKTLRKEEPIISELKRKNVNWRRKERVNLRIRREAEARPQTSADPL